MTETLKKLFSYGCIHCGAAVSDKSHILCPLCEESIRSYLPHDCSVVICAVSYKTEQAKTLIKHMKIHHDPYVFDYAASLIEEKLKDMGLWERLSDFSVTYAPRKPVTYLKRRFDQSREIADFLALRLSGDDSARAFSMFTRRFFSKEQKYLDSRGRFDNVKKLFGVKSGIEIPKKLIIVDDITTTGATLEALHELAVESGVSECILCAVAKNNKG